MFFPIRWKLTFGLLSLTLVFLGAYILLAKETFESDKISYVFEAQQNQVDMIASDLNRSLEKGLFEISTLGHLILAGGGEAARLQFEASTDLVALEARLENSNAAPILRLEKNNAVLNLVPTPADDKSRRPVLRVLNDGMYGVSLRTSDARQEPVLVKGVFRVESGLRDAHESQILFLSEGTTPIAKAGVSVLEDRLLREVMSRTNPGAAITRMEPVGGEDYLVSRSALVQDRFNVWALTPKKEALGALRGLYNRSMVFFVLSFFAVLLVAFLLSWTLTRGLRRLTVAAERLGQGDFSAKPDVRGRDEIGILGATFRRMMDQIQELITATVDKARMENELRTARVVQQNLFPHDREWQSGHFRLAGFYETSTECGGDWWFYFHRGTRLHVIIADATGHGTPAALITSAARAVYSQAEKENLALHQIAERLDKAIHDCSDGKLGMTALLLDIDTERGLCSYLSASHESPVVLTPTQDGFQARFLATHPGSTLGEGRGVWSENSFHLEPGERLVLWTDGLTDMLEAGGKALGDKRFLKQFEKAIATAKTPAELCMSLESTFHALGGNAPLRDDVTLVVIENIKKRI